MKNKLEELESKSSIQTDGKNENIQPINDINIQEEKEDIIQSPLNKSIQSNCEIFEPEKQKDDV